MKKTLLIGAMVMALAACDRTPAQNDTITRQCGDYNVQIAFGDSGENITASINGQVVEMASVVAASGAKYEGQINNMTFALWQSGNDWIMVLPDETVLTCVAN